jgi:hypothetical protein
VSMADAGIDSGATGDQSMYVGSSKKRTTTLFAESDRQHT